MYKLLIILSISLLFIDFSKSTSKNDRDGKFLSLFSIVQFKNEACRSTSTISNGGSGSTSRNGTCYTDVECTNKGGLAAGQCAAGFGRIVPMSQIPGFPNAYTGSTAVSYTINKAHIDICKLRLDFESFTTNGPSSSEEVDGGKCVDTFMITTSTLVDQSVPTICGQNTGQHVYIDIGNGESDTAQMRFNFMGDSGVRMWEIKVSQLKCDAPFSAPPGCLQYHEGLTGKLTTFNSLLRTQAI
ncbi:unnamed protein product [Lepeophtheirus salmonis]|uniref:(salmon louse) hypothetical protein n=1 Tax=Lepeophtheirus salmonis TaxID=72036 RepID=A0A7R8CD23_LEPSM|nr:unnamed protein product [Lepeophtheirus salmonis]CAF2775392.1 unnamed protein product [Lepeophtheirus salmonis]